MVRDEDDSWSIEDSVGATALATAIVRAGESVRDDRLYSDPFAQHFLDVAASRGWEQPYGADTAQHLGDTDPALAAFVTAMTGFAVCRTKFIDDFLTDAVAGGLSQIVILAAGLDARAWRMAALSGATVYEVDQPKVLEFKAEALRTVRAEPVATAVPVGIDLRREWPKRLQENGLQPSEPTAWIVEGLLPYVPPTGQDVLFERIHALSAPGSRIAVDAYRPEFYVQDSVRAMFERMDDAATPDSSADGELIYGEDLVIGGDRAAPAVWLADHGWNTETEFTVDVMARLGRPVPAGVDIAPLSSDLIAGRLLV